MSKKWVVPVTVWVEVVVEADTEDAALDEANEWGWEMVYAVPGFMRIEDKCDVEVDAHASVLEANAA